jgi:AraC-like DNA-binding protein/mannose-6-phosphate isomerase-like protein (cupin superfamily)
VDRLNRQSEDSLSKLLRVINVQSTVYCLSEFRAPWGFHVEHSAVAKFHLTLSGKCVLALDNGDRFTVNEGEVIVLPLGSGHTVQDRFRTTDVPSLESILTENPPTMGRLRYGGRGRSTRLLCGGFALSDALPARLLALLPPVLRFDMRAVGASGVAALVDVIQAQAEDEQPGAPAIFAKIADVFLTQVLRTYLLTAESSGAIQVGPLQHPAIASAIELMRKHMDRPWTVPELAREVGMSRTLFVTRFSHLVGHPPMRFLTRLRLSQVAGDLATTNQTLFAIARRAGYETEASLSKAFKREFGVAPGVYRRQSLEHPVVIRESRGR